MKQTRLSAIAIAITTLSFTACSDAPKGDKATVADEQQAASATGESFRIDSTDSHIRFTGNGVGKNHPGKFKISSGTIAVANGQITGGQFIIDVNSLDMEEEGDAIDNKLRPHLLSGDFLDAEKHKEAKFEITKVEPYRAGGDNKSVIAGANYTISGNLTLKDVTKNVTFPAKVDVDNDGVEAKANFDIDRRQWNIIYGNDKSLGDKFISETVNIEVDVDADKM